MMFTLLTLTVIILIAAGQILWKLGVSNQIHSFDTFLKAVMSPLVIVGMGIYIVAAAIWIFALSKYQYHHIYPWISLTFVLALLAARFIFHEQVSWLSWLGVGVICLGLIIIGFSGK